MDLTKNNGQVGSNLRPSDLQRLSEWIHCICVVTFDLELGQSMEAIYPPSVELSEKEKLNICYLAFPDSNSGCIGDTQFHIRLRVAPGTKNTLLNSDLQRFSLQCITVQRPDLGHFWGFVYFRQMKDSSLPRGYFQKSVILLTRLPFINLYTEVLAVIAPKYFDGGEHILDSVCQDISNWPSLQAGECIRLPLLGNVFQTYIPSLTSANLQQPSSMPTNQRQEQIDDSIENLSLSSTNDSKILESTPIKVENGTKINNTNQSDQSQAPSGIVGQSRDDILDSYKQSKELLIAQKSKLDTDSPCDSPVDSMEAIVANTVNDNDDVEDVDSSEGSEENSINILNNSDVIKLNETADNTQSKYGELVKRRPLSVASSMTKIPIVLSSVHEIDIFRSLYSVISYTHLLWELVVTAEPIVVMATSPSDCSHMVQSLMSLIAPLPYAAEARPYFTIHDSEFKEFTQRQQGPVPIILGVTNPFFSKTLQHWPHLIRMSDNNNGSSSNANATNNSSGMLTQQGLRKLKIFTKILDTPPGVYTQYKPFLQKDKTIIRKLLAGVKKQRPAEAQSVLLRRHLLELTQSFMIPLERYMASLMPLQKDISAFRAAPTPNHFKQDTFLATLEQSGPQLTSPLKGDWSGLYKRFFRSPNFLDWYEHRYRELTQTLQHLQMQALSNTNLKQWVVGRHEVEIVDMILKVKQKLKICNDISMDGLPQAIIAQNETTRKQLHRHLEDMKCFLPDDLNKILSS